jgi:putative peptidoglycan lipid II flippase
MPPSDSRRLFQLRSLIVAAAILHVCVAFAVFMVGKYQLFPSQIYPSGIGKFASDGLMYQTQLVELGNILKANGPIAWATWPTQLHLRLYSLPLALVSRWVSFNILVIEPVNVLLYLSIVLLVFKLSERIFGYRTALMAATVVALWPSLLLHTTQLLRDPLLIVAVLLLIWCLVQMIERDFSWRRVLWLGVASIASLVTIRIVRLPMWYVIVGSVATAILFFAVRLFRERRFNAAEISYAALLIVSVVVIPKLQPFFHNQQVLRAPRFIENEEWQKLPVEQQIYGRREAFKYRIDQQGQEIWSEDGSRIDTDVTLESRSAIIRHLPRATVVGFFAPFPNMWLRSGKQVGSGGRLISGFETLFTYVIESMALFGWWWQRRNFAAWLLAIMISMGAVSLGLVVNNMGAMYRLRYPFWALMVVLGAGGLTFLLGRIKDSGSSNNGLGREAST